MPIPESFTIPLRIENGNLWFGIWGLLVRGRCHEFTSVFCGIRRKEAVCQTVPVPLWVTQWLSSLPYLHVAIAEVRPRSFAFRLKPFSSHMSFISFCHYWAPLLSASLRYTTLAYERPTTSVPVFMNQRNSEEDFCF